MSSRPRASVWPWLALAGAGGAWGTGFLFGKIGLRELSVSDMLLYRFGIASVMLAWPAWRLWRSGSRSRPEPIARRDWSLLGLAALLGVPLQFLVQFEGLARTTVAHASLMIGGLPILLAVASSLFARERLARWEWAVIALSTAGAALIAFGTDIAASQGPTLVGDTLVFVSLLAAVGWTLLSKQLTRRHDPLMVSVMTTWIGTLFLAMWTVLREGAPRIDLSTMTWGAVFAQALVATTGATVLWNWGVARVPASRAGVFVNLEPIVGASLGVLVLGETLGASALLGGGLILGAAMAMAIRAVIPSRDRAT